MKMGEAMKAVVVDIGGTAIKHGIIENGVLHSQKESQSSAHLGGPYIMSLVENIIAQEANFDVIGISSASQIDSEKGLVRYANSNIPSYTGTKIRQILQGKFCVPVAVENDVNCAAVGEALFGAGRNFPGQDFLCLTYGTGVGGAAVIGGKIYKGAAFSAGEFGHIITHAQQEHQASSWEHKGFYEKYASTSALVREVQKTMPHLSDGRKIFAQLNSPQVKEIVDNWIAEVLYGLASLVHIFNPALIVLGGGVMKEGYIITQLQSRLPNYIMPSYTDVCIRPAELGNNAGLLGIGHLAAQML